MSSKPLSASQLRKFRSNVAKLKSKGLVSARVDARSQRPTRHMLGQVKKFSDVLTGKSQVVTVKKGAGKSAAENAKQYEGTFKRKGRHLVVPKTDKADQVRFDAKSGKIKRYGKTPSGDRYVSELDPKGIQRAGQSRFPEGPGILYRVPFGSHGAAFTFDSLKELYEFMTPYEEKANNPYRDWQNYVEIIRMNPKKVRRG